MKSANTCAALIHYAARTAPDSLSERLEEEWLADLAEQHGGLSRLRFAIGCCWATRVIAHEHLISGMAISRSGAGHSAMGGFAPASFSSRRSAVLLLIIAVHAILIYGFASAFVHGVIKVPTITHGSVVNAPQRHLAPPPPIDPRWTSARPVLPRIDGVFSFPPDDTGTITTLVPQPLPTGGTSPPPHPLVTRMVGGPGPGFPSAEDYYPPAARRLGAQGVATVQVCVNEAGRLSAPATIAQTSGSTSLDEGALKLATAGSGHYRATTEDRRPVSDCYPVRIRFQLMD
jgi:TonB family protein